MLRFLEVIPMPHTRMILGSILLVACAAMTTAQDKQKFEVKFEKDKSFFQETTTDIQQTIKVQGGSDLTQKHKQTFMYKWTPTTQAGDKWTVKQVIEAVKMTMDIAGNQTEYDSTNSNPAAANSNPNLADFFGKLVNSEFLVTIGKGMIVEKVDGKDEFLKKLNAVNPQMEVILRKMLSDEAMKQMTDPSFSLTPPGEKAVNETWEKKSSIPLGPVGTYEVTYKFTYKGKDPVKKDLDRVEVASILAYKPPTEAGDGLLFKIKGGELKTEDAKPDAKPNFILFDPKTGRIVESSVGVKLKGNLNVTIGSADMTVEIYQEQTTTTKTADTSFLPKK
jgi:hypothetical protein